MNALSRLDSFRIHISTNMLPVKKVTFSKCIPHCSVIVLYSRLAMTAACNSKRGIVNSLSGETLDLAVINRHSYSLFDIFQRRWEHASNKSFDASANMHSVRGPILNLKVLDFAGMIPYLLIHFFEIFDPPVFLRLWGVLRSNYNAFAIIFVGQSLLE